MNIERLRVKRRIDFLFVLLAACTASMLVGLLLVIYFNLWSVTGLLAIELGVVLSCLYSKIPKRMIVVIVVSTGIGWWFGSSLEPQISMDPNSRLNYVASRPLAGREGVLVSGFLSTVFALLAGAFVSIPNSNASKKANA